MHRDCESVLIGSDEIGKRVAELAETINRDIKEKVLVISVLKGSVLFLADLFRRLEMPTELDFMAVSSYGAGTVSSGQLRIKKDLTADVNGKDVLIVEDICDSGLTLTRLCALLRERGARSVRTAVLLDKRERRVCEFMPDYTGFIVPDAFVVGYGLDYDERYRNLPYIGILKSEIYEGK